MREDVIGFTILFKDEKPLTLAGIIRYAPENSHIQFDAILTIDPAEDGYNNWYSNNYHTYIDLSEDADPTLIDEKLKTYIRRYVDPTRIDLNSGYYYLQPLADI